MGEELAGKVVIVTGASSGIGRAAALLFAAEGGSVVAGARRRAALDRLVEEVRASGGEATAFAGDVTDESYAEAMVATAEERYGGLDVALNNAGTMGQLEPTDEVRTAAWRETLEVNLTSAFLAAKAQLPAMLRRGGGSLIFTSSFVGHGAALPCTASYAASKAGLIGLMKTLAVEFGPRGIRVNALLPGGTDTAMAADFADSEDKRAFVRSIHALKRMALPEEIARSALYLASGASSFTTGVALLVDGGASINKT